VEGYLFDSFGLTSLHIFISVLAFLLLFEKELFNIFISGQRGEEMYFLNGFPFIAGDFYTVRICTPINRNRTFLMPFQTVLFVVFF
jgi:hypothetical protein